MKPVFDENGLATEPGNIRCFYYGPETGEYSGWSDEYINLGVSMPGYSTDKDPGDEVSGKVAVFTDGEWTQEEDHRGETVYSITDAKASTVDYIGPINAGYTSISPSGPYQKWNGKTWVTDADAKQAADLAAAEQKKASLIANAQATISLWQTELQLGLISDEDKASLIAWMKYIKAVQTVDTSKAPDIIWPDKPE
ncbi:MULTISPECIES: tail fiber assembly protein [Enterobacter cloacae complex]|uniref:Phage tail assembly chaperone gp38 n=1 Tax=Enterobacter cloacae TaxID=550 RepID=A0A144L2N1_ENTCL|nr:MULTISPECIES: tail fiber assembly protein [Enterobacter cloacae complex]MEC5767833.1 tail fiber assembly protein [Enterobacter chengduensis]CZV47376.1 phage tail assembly chaperone gp38 [Enterobacter cloacae]HCD3309338.1 tail fiber assembly protein [Enterobacter chengduensis]